MRVSELSGNALNYWVARAMGATLKRVEPLGDVFAFLPDCQYASLAAGGTFRPAEIWDQGGPIIEKELIELSHDRDWREDGEFGRIWGAHNAGSGHWYGDTPLIAAMRSIVAEKFGETVPDEAAA